jgi:hypothetical protein
MKSEYPTPWRVVCSLLRPQFPTKIIEVCDAHGHTVLPWSALDDDGRPYAQRLRLARRIVAAVNAQEHT